MPKKKNVRRSKKNRKKAPPSKKATRREKPAPKKRPAAKKSPVSHVTLVETFEVDVVNGAPEAEEPTLIDEEIDDDLAPDIAGSE